MFFSAAASTAGCRRLWRSCHIAPKFVQSACSAPLFGHRPLSAADSAGTILHDMRRWDNGAEIIGGWGCRFRGLKVALLASAGAGALIATMSGANAGGFAVREQSAWGQGTSFAGVAAGGDLSAMFWNPATMTQIPGMQSSGGAERHHAFCDEHTRRRHLSSRSGVVARHRRYGRRRDRAEQLLFLADQAGHVARHGGQCAVRPVGELSDQLGRRSICGRQHLPEDL